MTQCSGEEYYHKADNMMLISCQYLRKLFRTRWNKETGKDWVDEKDQGKEYIEGIGQRIYKQAHKIQKVMIANGNLEDWDMSTLSMTLLNFGNANEYGTENNAIRALAQIRNDLAHHPNKKLSKDEYEKKAEILQTSLNKLGMSRKESAELIKKAGATSSLQALESVKKLYARGEKLEKAGDTAKAIQCYSEAITMPSLLPINQGVAYEKRSNCYITMVKQGKSSGGGKTSSTEGGLLHQALVDANQALELNDNSWNAHYLIAQIHRLDNKLADAINHFRKALAISPAQKQVKLDLDACKVLAASQARFDHLNPHQMPMNLTERAAHLEAETGINISGDQFLKLKSFEGKLFEGQDHVNKGHQYFAGWNVPQDFSEAARCYAKAAQVGNAEGIYNLGMCYQYGKGVAQDVSQAFKYYMQAAEMSPDTKGQTTQLGKNSGVSGAQHALGLMYDEGIYVEQDHGKAAMWYKRSADNGVGNAANNLANLYSRGRGVPLDEKMAEMYWNHGVVYKDTNAAQSLMNHYIFHMEPEKARNMFSTGKKLGHVGMREITDKEFNMMIRHSVNRRDELKEEVTTFELEHKLDIKGMTFLERLRRKMSFRSVSDKKMFELLDSMKSKKCWGGKMNHMNLTNPDVAKGIAVKAEEGSVTALRLMETMVGNMEVVNLLARDDCATEEKKATVVDLLYKCSTLEQHAIIIPAQLVDKLKRIIGGLFDEKCDTKGEDDLKVRLCYVAFNLVGSMTSGDTYGLELLKEGIRRYPDNQSYYQLISDLYGNKSDYKSSLRYAENGLKKFPDNVSLLYTKAVNLRLIDTEGENTRDVIDAYNKFLSEAPYDHRKVPEAYYAIGSQYIPEVVVELADGQNMLQHYYKLGLEAEKKQLPCYLPYGDSSVKKMIECLLPEHIFKPSSASASGKSRSPKENKVGTEPSLLERKKYLRDPSRKAIILRHRQSLLDMSKQRPGTRSTNTSEPRLRQKCPRKMAGMRSITLKEMNPTSDHIYEDHIIDLTIIEDAVLGYPSVHLIAEDANGDVTRLYIYNVEQNRETQGKLGYGCRIAIINPYMRLAVDVTHGIRVDEPRCIVYLERVENMCGCCGEDGAPHKCSKCKRSYCSRECQQWDWKELNHKMICSVKV